MTQSKLADLTARAVVARLVQEGADRTTARMVVNTYDLDSYLFEELLNKLHKQISQVQNALEI
jgi:hypothetical protein